MAVQWATTSQLSTTHGTKVLVYSGAGAGKTLLCATAPRPLLISAESGVLSLSRRNIEKVFGVGTPGISYDIPVMEVKTLAQLVEAYQWLLQPSNRAREHFSTVCIDSLSEIAEVMLANLKANTKDPRQAYGEMMDRMMVLVRNFRDLAGFNVYMSAKMEYSKDEGSGFTKYQPSMPGNKVGQQLPYLFDEVWYLGVNRNTDGSSYRYLKTQPDAQYVAKDRSGALDEYEMPALFNAFYKISGVH